MCLYHCVPFLLKNIFENDLVLNTWDRLPVTVWASFPSAGGSTLISTVKAFSGPTSFCELAWNAENLLSFWFSAGVAVALYYCALRSALWYAQSQTLAKTFRTRSSEANQQAPINRGAAPQQSAQEASQKNWLEETGSTGFFGRCIIFTCHFSFN